MSVGGLLGSGSAALLFLGNSYTGSHDLEVQVADRLVASGQGGSVETAAVHPGGAMWVDHVEALAVEGTPQQQAVALRSWDWWVLQEQSQVPGFPEGQTDRVASEQAVVTLAAQAELEGGAPMLFLTWGRRDGDAMNPDLYPDYLEMQDRLTEGYLAYVALLESAGHEVAVAPVGEAFRAVYEGTVADGGSPLTAGSPFANLYAADGSHPSGYGTYLASAVIEGALTGRSSSLSSSLSSLKDPEFAAYLDEVARAVVHDAPLGSFPYPWAMTFAEWGSEEVSHPDLWLWVRLERSEEGEVLTLGTTDAEGCRGGGRLEVVKGGLWTGERVDVGLSGDGELHMAGGELEAHTLTLGAQASGEGRLVLEGGVLRLQRLEIGAGVAAIAWSGGAVEVGEFVGLPLDHAGGALVVTGEVWLEGDYAQGQEGEVHIAPGASLTVSGDASLSGRVEVAEIEGDSAVILEASKIELQDVSWALGEGLTWVQEVAEDRVQLRVDREATSYGADTGGGGASTDCGCRTGLPTALPWVWVLLVLVRRRR